MQEIINILIFIIMKCSGKLFMWIPVDSNLCSKFEHHLLCDKRLKQQAMHKN